MDVAFVAPFWRVNASSESHRVLGPFSFLTKKMLLLEPSLLLRIQDGAHTRTQQKRVPEEGGIGRTSMVRNLLHAFQAPSMSAYLRDAVSAAGPLSHSREG